MAIIYATAKPPQQTILKYSTTVRDVAPKTSSNNSSFDEILLSFSYHSLF